MSRWLAALVTLTVTSAAHADVSLVDKDNGTLTLGGYARTALMVEDAHRLELPDAVLPRATSGVGAGVLRLEWTAGFGERVVLDAHQRLAWRTPQSSGIAAAAGLGVTQAPDRTVDMSYDIVGEESLLLQHDIDRLALRFYAERADIYVGRQAISWGRALMLPSTDVWSRFGQFELDTTEKPGVDSVRVLTAPWDNAELEFVVVDRASDFDCCPFWDLSGGVRASLYLDRSDVYLFAAKNWNALNFGGGFARDFETVSLRLDALMPWSIPELGREVEALPRATVGVDHFRTKWSISGELHYNGAGAFDVDDYAARLAGAPEYSRGEVQLLGVLYAGLLFGYRPVEPFALNLVTLANLTDGSLVAAPSASWAPMQDVELSLGGYVPFGEPPSTEAILPQARSEFGSLPVTGYFEMAVFY